MLASIYEITEISYANKSLRDEKYQKVVNFELHVLKESCRSLAVNGSVDHSAQRTTPLEIPDADMNRGEVPASHVNTLSSTIR